MMRRIRIAIGMFVMRIGAWIAGPPRFKYDGKFNVVVGKRRAFGRLTDVTK